MVKKAKTWSEVVTRWECPYCEAWMEYDGAGTQSCPYCGETVEVVRSDD